ncbi:MAG: hypothetical protein ACOY71_13795 [Gemmatimonadota bacterium]
MPDDRLLLISYHFPPAQTAGALRWEKLARYAAERGYGLDVVTLDPAQVPRPDHRRVAALPAGTTITGVREEPVWSDRLERGLWKLLRGTGGQPGAWTGQPSANHGDGSSANGPPSTVNGARPVSLAPEEIRWSLAPRAVMRLWWTLNFWHRDAAWARAAAAAGRRLLTRAHRAVITCGPPHQAHRAGARLARESGLPFIMDLRDPWSLPRRLPEHLASPLNFTLAGWAERRCVDRASLVACNTEPLRDAMRRRYPAAQERIIAVMNGYDDEPLPAANHRSNTFTVTYAGALYLDRDPRLFLRAAGRVARDLALAPEEFEIVFLGSGPTFGNTPITALAEEEGVGGFVRVLPRLPRADALAFLARSTMLLNLPQDSPYAVPSKVFEYLMFENWVLALAAPGTPTATALRGTGVDVLAPNDVDGIARLLRARIEAFRRGERPGPIAGRERLSRTHQARILFDAIDRVVGR